MWFRRVASRTASVDRGDDAAADVHRAGIDPHAVRARQPRAEPRHALDARQQRAVRIAELADVRHLAAGLEVERRPVEHDVPFVAAAERLHLGAGSHRTRPARARR